MALRTSRNTLLILFGVFVFVPSFYLIAGNRVRDQPTLEDLEGVPPDAQSMKERQSQPNINIRPKEPGARLGPYLPKALEESNELMSRILSGMQPTKTPPQAHLAWKKMKRWALSKTKENPFKKRRARFAKRKARPRPVYRQGPASRKHTKRHACMPISLKNGEAKIQGEKHRCVRSSYFGDEESEKTQAILRHFEESKGRKTDWDNSNSERIAAYKNKQMLKERGKRATYTVESHILSSKPFYSYDSSYSLSSFFPPRTTARRASLQRRKRSISRFPTRDTNLDEAFLSNLLKAKKEESRENAQTGQYLQRREATGKIPVRTIRLTLTALKTQEKLSEMVDHISDPSNHMSKDEKLTYMHELLNELTSFMQLLQQQVARQSQSDATNLATTSTPQS